jgi:hypothetical protein
MVVGCNCFFGPNNRKKREAGNNRVDKDLHFLQPSSDYVFFWKNIFRSIRWSVQKDFLKPKKDPRQFHQHAGTGNNGQFHHRN